MALLVVGHFVTFIGEMMKIEITSEDLATSILCIKMLSDKVAEDVSWNGGVYTADLVKLKKYCKQFLEVPLVIALNDDD